MDETPQEALQEVHRLRRTRADLRFSYDMLGEGARTDADALALPNRLPFELQRLHGNSRRKADRSCR